MLDILPLHLSEFLLGLAAALTTALLALSAFIAIRAGRGVSRPSLLPVILVNLGNAAVINGIAHGSMDPFSGPWALLWLADLPVAAVLSARGARTVHAPTRIAYVATALVPALLAIAHGCEEVTASGGWGIWGSWVSDRKVPEFGVIGLCYLCLVAAAYVIVSRGWLAKRPLLRAVALCFAALIPVAMLTVGGIAARTMEKARDAAAAATSRSETLAQLRECAGTLNSKMAGEDADESLRKGDRRLRAIYRVGQEVMVPNVPPLLVDRLSCEGVCISDWVEGREHPRDHWRRYAIATSPKGQLANDPWGLRRDDADWRRSAAACEQASTRYLVAYNRIVLDAGADTIAGK